MDRQYIGERLISLRKAKGMTQEEVAKAIGISASAYSQYETGAKIPRDDTKVAISKFFNRSVQFIFFNYNTHLK